MWLFYLGIDQDDLDVFLLEHKMNTYIFMDNVNIFF